jgi:hypothetical protein
MALSIVEVLDRHWGIHQDELAGALLRRYQAAADTVRAPAGNSWAWDWAETTAHWRWSRLGPKTNVK